MKKNVILAIMLICSTIAMSQELITSKVVIGNDSIYEMGTTNGRSQILIPSPLPGKSIVVQSINVTNVTHTRLYSPDSGSCEYLIGYQKGEYWYNLSVIPFDELNMTGNTTLYYSVQGISNIWNKSIIVDSPIVIKFSKPMNFTIGYNELTIIMSYRILE